MQFLFWFAKLYSAQAIVTTCTNEPGTFYAKNVNKCVPCPRGRFASSNTCVQCPTGKYSNRSGISSVLDCELCAPGTFQTSPGGILCDGTCPDGTYSTKWGSDSFTDCKTCPRGLASFQCGFDITHKQGSHEEDPQTTFHSSMFGDHSTRSKPVIISRGNVCGKMNNVCMHRHIQ
jgi:hypothetical protein